ncbi:hypothetical protein ATE47_12300 [Chryseobacterium sp. IHB B 17019]|uniref:hypothetical protein n=1 Tax=Chryseobacterium sp. IHB B 17019 TaxID=1721091 RepID=UPI00071F61E3|nr:hypothetical protein [Chryseobacterium sp. IHB B 17019]ALR31253.1 hypothetical protein ATE47_12300 [Chryseobacterium sp. IHB B 17019]
MDNQIIDGKQKLTYDANVNTIQEATAAGYEHVYEVADSGQITNSDTGSLAYSLNSDGTVTDATGDTSYGTFTTTGGIDVQAKGAFDLTKWLSHLGNEGGDFYTNLGGAGLGQGTNPFFRGDIDKIVDVEGYFGGIHNGLSRGDKGDPSLMNFMVDIMALGDLALSALGQNKAPDSMDVSKDASNLIDTIHRIPRTNMGINNYYDKTSPKLDSISSSRLHNWAIKNYGKK